MKERDINKKILEMESDSQKKKREKKSSIPVIPVTDGALIEKMTKVSERERLKISWRLIKDFGVRYYMRDGRVYIQNSKPTLSKGSFWSEDEVLELEKLVKKGKTDKEIAKILNRTVKSIRRKRERIPLLKIGVSYWKEEDILKLKRLFAKGKSDKEIAESLTHKRSDLAIESKRRRLGLKRLDMIKSPISFRTKLWKEEETIRLRKLFKDGLSDKEISSLLSRSPKAIIEKRKKLRLLRK